MSAGGRPDFECNILAFKWQSNSLYLVCRRAEDRLTMNTPTFAPRSARTSARPPVEPLHELAALLRGIAAATPLAILLAALAGRAP